MVLCKFFQQGSCRFGSKCVNEHFDVKQVIKTDVEAAINGKQWPLSTYGPFKDKPSIPNFIEDQSFEEVRMLCYEAKQKNFFEQFHQQFNKEAMEANNKMKALLQLTPDIIEVAINIYDSPSDTSSSGVTGTKTTNANNPFGLGNTTTATNAGSIFAKSNTNNNVFGAAANSGSIFGNSAFGGQQQQQQQQQQSSIFGQAAKPANSIFGGGTNNMNNQQTNSIFGQQQNQSSVFAQPQQQQQQNSIFGQQNSQNTNLFRQASQTNQPPQGLFAQAAQTMQQTQPQQQGLFAQAAQQTQPQQQGLFAQAAQQTQSIFGQTMQQQQQQQPNVNIFQQQTQAAAQQQQQPQQQQTNLFQQQSQQQVANQQQQQPPPSGLFQQAAQQTQNVAGQMTQQQVNSSVYSRMEDLTPDEIEAFKADFFQPGKIPFNPPPRELIH